MGKSTSVKREIRFQQWIQQVKEYNERPDGMSMSGCQSIFSLSLSFLLSVLFHQPDSFIIVTNSEVFICPCKVEFNSIKLSDC